MVEKINAEIEKLEKEKATILDGAAKEAYIKEEVAKYEATLRADLDAKKDSDIQVIDYKLAVLKDWLNEELNKPQEVAEEVCEEKVEEVVEEAPVVEEVAEVEEQPKAPIVY